VPDDTFRSRWGRELPPAALLNDVQIQMAIEKHGLLVNPAVFYDPNSVKYASYEVHAAPEVGRLDFLEDGELEEAVRTQTKEISIAPGDTVRLFTAEHFSLPSDVFATVTGLGQLYAAGLTVGSTYVDPGTSYRIYLSVSNVSDREVIIPAGSPIGRAQFFVLGSPSRTLKRSAWRTDLGYRKGRSVEDPKLGELAQRLQVVELQQSELQEQSAAVKALPLGNVGGETVEALTGLRRTVRLYNTWLAALTALVILSSAPNQVWSWLSGSGLPPPFSFVVPAVAGGVFFLIVTLIVRRLIDHFGTERSHSETRSP